MRINLFFENVVYFWVKPYYDGDDLNFVKCQAETIGTAPEWFDELLSDGIDNLIGARTVYIKTEFGFENNQSNLHWCIENGIAPKQPFCLEVYSPTHTTDYWGECDMDFDSGVYKIEEIKNPLKNWTEVFAKIKRDNFDEKLDSIRRKKELITNNKNWHLRFDVFGGNYYSDEDIKVRLSLMGKNNSIFSVEAKTHEECKEKMFNKIMLNFPELSIEDFHNLKIRN